MALGSPPPHAVNARLRDSTPIGVLSIAIHVQFFLFESMDCHDKTL